MTCWHTGTAPWSIDAGGWVVILLGLVFVAVIFLIDRWLEKRNKDAR